MKAVKNIKKFFRFISIYGLSRTLIKMIGRYKLKAPGIYLSLPKKKYVSVVGCGQFAFSTICYFLRKKKGNVFLSCYDVNKDNAKFLARFYHFSKVANSFEELIEDKKLKAIYIASNHHSHTEYAIEALNRNIDVHVEKPISVSKEQFSKLSKAIANSQAKIYAGYNRPFSSAICEIKKYIKNKNLPLSLNCFVSGHFIPIGHWYRNPEEGTRICGNIGHWLDLAIHLFALRGKIPDNLSIQISYSNVNEPDDNILISISSDVNDIVNIMLTARCEPFEGIYEGINLQCGNIIAKIDDFRNLTIWQDEKLIKKTFYPKDVGHERAIMQIFENNSRNWNEVELSTLLMLHISEMVKKNEKSSMFATSEKTASIK